MLAKSFYPTLFHIFPKRTVSVRIIFSDVFFSKYWLTLAEALCGKAHDFREALWHFFVLFSLGVVLGP